MVSLLAVLEYSDSYPTVYRYFYVEWNRVSVFHFTLKYIYVEEQAFNFEIRFVVILLTNLYV